MTGAMVVFSAEGRCVVSRESFEQAADSWPDSALLASSDDQLASTCDLTLRIQDEDRSWQIFHATDGTQLWTDGDRERQLRFAAWARSLAGEEPAEPVILLSDDGSVAATLRPGMRTDEIDRAWTEAPPW